MVVDHPLYFQLILWPWDDVVLEPRGRVKRAGAGQRARVGGRVALGGPSALTQGRGRRDMVRHTGGGGSLPALLHISHAWGQRGNSHGSIILLIKLYFDTITSGMAVQRPICVQLYMDQECHILSPCLAVYWV